MEFNYQTVKPSLELGKRETEDGNYTLETHQATNLNFIKYVEKTDNEQAIERVSSDTF